MSTSNPFGYLDQADHNEFKECWGTESEEFLVYGFKTLGRLIKYLSNDDLPIKMVLTVIIRDFQLPEDRSTLAVALLVCSALTQNSPVSERDRHIFNTEHGILFKHLTDEENSDYRERYDLVTSRWNEYMDDPEGFKL